MFFIFLLMNNFLQKNLSISLLGSFYITNKNIIQFFCDFFWLKRFNRIFFYKEKLNIVKKIRKFTLFTDKTFNIFKKRIDLADKRKAAATPPFYLSFFFIHKFFAQTVIKVKSNSIFLTHRQMPAFSIAVADSDTFNQDSSYFFYKKIPTIIKFPKNVSFILKNMSKIAEVVEQVKNAQESSKKDDIYQFLENNPYQSNKEKNFLFFDTYYSFYLNNRKKFNKKKSKFPGQQVFKIIKNNPFIVFVKRFKKTTFLFKAVFKDLPKQLLEVETVFFNFLSYRLKTIRWNDLKQNFFNIWPQKNKKTKICPVKRVKLFKFKSLNFKIKLLKYKVCNIFLPKWIDFSFYDSSINMSIYFISKWRSFFILQNLGFFFQTIFEFNSANFSQNLANFRKEIYSFTMKNELEKKTLKKYFFSNNVEYYGENFEKLDLFFEEKKLSSSDFFHFYNAFNFFRSDVLKSDSWGKYYIKKSFWSLENIEEMDLTIRRVRFKPGYSIIWREARNVLKSNLNVDFRYQHRLTKYVLRFKKTVKHKLYLINDFNFLNLVIRIKFFPDYHTSIFFFKNNFVFLNKTPCSNESLQIFIGDFIQLTVTSKYYLFYKNLINGILKKKKKIDNIAKKKSFVPSNIEEKQRTNNYPKWILNNKNILEDVSKYLEVDFYTLSCVVLYEPFLWSELNPLGLIRAKFDVINMYNWKYIN